MVCWMNSEDAIKAYKAVVRWIVNGSCHFQPVPEADALLEGYRVVFSRRDSGLVKRRWLEEPIARWHE